MKWVLKCTHTCLDESKGLSVCLCVPISESLPVSLRSVLAPLPLRLVRRVFCPPVFLAAAVSWLN